MPISVRCPACGVLVDAPDEAEGRLGRCPNCGWTFQIESSEWGAMPLSESQEPEESHRVSRMAMASLVSGCVGVGCGVLALFDVLPLALVGLVLLSGAVLALIFGVSALIQISRNAALLYGRVVALAGTILGGGALLLFLVHSATLVSMREEYCGAACRGNLRVIGKGIRLYMNDFEGQLPSGLAHLYPKYVWSPKVFNCPSRKTIRNPIGPDGKLDEKACGYAYIYYPGDWRERMSGPASRLPLAFDKHRHGYRHGVNVLFVSGRVEWVSWRRFLAMLKEASGEQAIPEECRKALKKVLDELTAEKK